MKEGEGADLVPGEGEYRDEGCDLFPSCLSCPFTLCRYDGGGRRRAVKGVRDGEILRLRREGRSIRELAQGFGLSRRTVQRVLRRSGSE